MYTSANLKMDCLVGSLLEWNIRGHYKYSGAGSDFSGA